MSCDIISTRNYHLVFHYERKYAQVASISQKLGSNHLFAYLQNDLLNALKNFQFIKHEDIAEDILAAGIEKYPDQVLKTLASIFQRTICTTYRRGCGQNCTRNH